MAIVVVVMIVIITRKYKEKFIYTGALSKMRSSSGFTNKFSSANMLQGNRFYEAYQDNVSGVSDVDRLQAQAGWTHSPDNYHHPASGYSVYRNAFDMITLHQVANQAYLQANQDIKNSHHYYA